ncbi:MAG: T9SS type A sorting domain-containing protein, partial [Flavobacteriales bacterium]|nr:T9SS type A sorting domain-containing protein [Flavobacteriales bacterium]
TGLQLMDVSGRLIARQHDSPRREIQLNISDLPRGVYLLEIETTDGRNSQRVIKN